MDHHQEENKNDDIDEMNKHLDAINQLNSEIKEWRAMIRQAMTLGISPPPTQLTISEFYAYLAQGSYRYQKAVCQVFLKLLKNSSRTGI